VFANAKPLMMFAVFDKVMSDIGIILHSACLFYNLRVGINQ